ncbi:hypothetical protein EPA86_18020 [Litorilituus lipolyticus]|uniref:Outer membrane lipoprotein carrier protein LolA n=2 Tax=Litorilituus lipolyticus TaxID=2491017 RepID=A0A502KPM3_9GAMM|nr:hypothetical protein EPA86_18020 [Litorilituus lipolyticus]
MINVLTKLAQRAGFRVTRSLNLLNSFKLLVLISLTKVLMLLSYTLKAETIQDSAVATSQVTSQTNTQANTVTVAELLEKLAIEQGVGEFTQQKHFKFLAMPITSTGRFLVNRQSALWQTEKPIFSQLLLTPEAIYRRLSIEQNFQALTQGNELSAILSTIFTGNIDSSQWDIAKQVLKNENGHCLALSPKTDILRQVFEQAQVCLAQGEQQTMRRVITLFEPKENKTEITMVLSSRTLSKEELAQLKINSPLSVNEVLTPHALQ